MIYHCHNIKNIFTVIEFIKPGDEIILYNGIYEFDDTFVIEKSGKQNLPIKIIGIGEVIFDFSKMKYLPYNRDNINNGINIYGNYLYFENIKVKFSPFRGIQCFGTNNIFNKIETSYNCDCGFMLMNHSNMVIDCYSHHNFDYKLIKNGEPKYGFNSDGFADKLYKGGSNRFINCISEFNGDDGYDFFEKINNNDPTLLINCISSYNGLKTIDMSDNKRVINDKEFIEENKINIFEYPNYGGGNGFKVGGRRPENIQKIKPINNITLINCKSSYDNGAGFMQNHNIGEIELIDCIYEHDYNINKNDLKLSNNDIRENHKCKNPTFKSTIINFDTNLKRKHGIIDINVNLYNPPPQIYKI